MVTHCLLYTYTDRLRMITAYKPVARAVVWHYYIVPGAAL